MTSRSKPNKSPTIAFLIGLLLPGAGFMYLGNWKVGAAFLGAALVIGVVFGLFDLPDAVVHGGSIGIAMASAIGAREEARRIMARPDEARPSI